MAISVLGIVDWHGGWDEEGYRSYSLKLLVESDSTWDGPANISLASGIPAVGAAWNFLSDVDLGVWCRPERSIDPVLQNEPNRHWFVELNFNNKPIRRCADSVDNPLLEPPQVSITFSRYTILIRYDQDGKAVISSSYEFLPDDVREADQPRPRVAITRNTATSSLAAATALLANIPGQPGPLNSSIMWGLPARTIRLANFTSNDRWYGSCIKYYEETFEFEIEYDTWWPWSFDVGYRHFEPADPDKLYADADPRTDFVGNLCPDRDAEGNETGTKSGPYLQYLDGEGRILDDYTAPVKQRLKKYGESNLLLLGIPSSL